MVKNRNTKLIKVVDLRRIELRLISHLARPHVIEITAAMHADTAGVLGNMITLRYSNIEIRNTPTRTVVAIGTQVVLRFSITDVPLSEVYLLISVIGLLC